MKTFRRTLSVNMEDPPEVERWRLITQCVYFAAAFGVFVLSATYALITQTDEAAPEVARLVINPEAHPNGMPEP